MTRRPLDQDPPDVICGPRPDYIIQERAYKLITPLFGGGVDPQKPDPVTIVRATEVRGQLRFWWRATRGGQYSTVAALKEAEDALWGSAASFNPDGTLKGGPSLVEVVVTQWTEGTPDVPFVVEGTIQKPRLKMRQGTLIPEYAAFPLQPAQKDQHPGMPIAPVWLDVTFTIYITFPQERHLDVEAALWAWETFGGIGARTRRGFGALELVTLNDKPPTNRAPAHRDEVRQWLRRHIGDYTEGVTQITKFTHLTADMQFGLTHPQPDKLACWRELIKWLKDFRNRQINHWPDADSVRRITRHSFKGLQNIPTGRNVFPRAVFGLPIVFHFKDQNKGDSDDITLQGREHDRLASPLIMRPLACADGRYIGLAAILEGPLLPPRGLKLKESPETAALITDLTPEEAELIPALSGDTDVLRAFLHHLERNQKR